MKTYAATPTTRDRRWLVIDAQGRTLGRLASEIAGLLRGKHKSDFTPHIDTGDFVVVVNTEGLVLTGSKRETKRYYRHSGYPGGLRSRTFAQVGTSRALELAVKGMMPRSRLGRSQLRKLKVYACAEHPHEAQRPVAHV